MAENKVKSLESKQKIKKEKEKCNNEQKIKQAYLDNMSVSAKMTSKKLFSCIRC